MANIIPLHPADDHNSIAAVCAAARDAPPPAVTWPEGFSQTAGVLYQRVPSKEIDPHTSQPKIASVRVAGPFTVDGVLSGANGRRCIRVSWTGDLGQHCTATPAVADLANPRSSVIYNELVGNGLPVEAGRERAFADALRGIRHRIVTRSVEAPGWLDLETGSPFYVTPAGAVIGRPADAVMLTEMRARPGQFVAQGTREGWQDTIGRRAEGNSRLVFAICASLAAPALVITGEPSGIFSFTGLSGDGKSSCLRVAGSVWGSSGGMVRNWKGTMAGVEALLATSSDGPLFLDEMGQANPKEIGEIVYMVGNEAGSARMTRGLSAAGLKTWRTVALSTGEETLEAVMRRAGAEFKGGMEVRCLVIPSDAGRGHRVYDTLHGEADDNTLSVLLARACTENYGHAGPAFLAAFVAAVQERRGALAEDWQASRDRFIAKHAGKDAAGPVKRAASRFALVAWVGEFAVAAGALPFPAGHAEWAAATCFRAWIAQRGHGGDSDLAAAVAKLRTFLSEHALSRMPMLIEDGGRQQFDRIPQHAGWRRRSPDGGTEYLLFTTTWATLFPMSQGKAVKDQLAAKGLHRSERLRLCGFSQRWHHVIDGRILDGE